MPHYRRFIDASVSEKILDTMFLITIGLGYLFALTHLYYSHQGRDENPGLSVEDIKITYYGEHQETRLGAALNGSMGANLESPVNRSRSLSLGLSRTHLRRSSTDQWPNSE
ncbi:hypothetical protein MMIC_P1614 [Mariprofundus micogutta]|uniref:Uncharacterized protein n=1 Tax=Mariprofundus micogutta TaxID=1921010 RepID=A0A1L8CNZ2_9PROT|nr:hypothetical protein [Mariprofundus micogutta]GAV20642.1 hypothetical protein MMIC_P1614 [Mariprofundus micogutta]